MASSSALSMTSVSTRCPNSFKSAQPSRPTQRLNRMSVVAKSRQEAGAQKAVMSGLAAFASLPLLFGGPAEAFVGNTASDFADKVEQVTPDVPLPGLKQKGKEAAAIGKGGASGPGAADQRLQADQLPIPEAVPSKSSVAQATDVVKDGGGVKGGDFSISDSDKVKGAASDVADKTGAGDVAEKAGGVLKDVKPKRGLFERINDEALTKNSPSVQQQQKAS